MKLHQLRYFVAVAEAGSIRQAARNLNRSQSAVAQSLNELEATLGTKLLERHSHSVVPSATGDALLRRAGIIEAELRYAQEEIRSIDGSMTGDVVVGLSPAAGHQILPKAIMNLKRRRPRANLRLRQVLFPECLEAVLSAQIDFYVGIIPDKRLDLDLDGLDVSPLVSRRLVPVARKEHPLANVEGLTYQELTKWDWISFGSREDRGRYFRDHFVRAELPMPPSTIETDSHSVLRALLEHGDYISFLGPESLRSSPWNESLVQLDVDGPVPSWNFVIIKRKNNLLSPLGIMLIQEIEKVVLENKAPEVAVKTKTGARL